jgi:hypothetical protein
MRNLQKAVTKLKNNIKASGQRCWNTNDQVYVSYFALQELIKYYEYSRDDAERILEARELLDKVYFIFQPSSKVMPKPTK